MPRDNKSSINTINTQLMSIIDHDDFMEYNEKLTNYVTFIINSMNNVTIANTSYNQYIGLLNVAVEVTVQRIIDWYFNSTYTDTWPKDISYDDIALCIHDYPFMLTLLSSRINFKTWKSHEEELRSAVKRLIKRCDSMDRESSIYTKQCLQITQRLLDTFATDPEVPLTYGYLIDYQFNDMIVTINFTRDLMKERNVKHCILLYVDNIVVDKRSVILYNKIRRNNLTLLRPYDFTLRDGLPRNMYHKYLYNINSPATNSKSKDVMYLLTSKSIEPVNLKSLVNTIKSTDNVMFGLMYGPDLKSIHIKLVNDAHPFDFIRFTLEGNVKHISTMKYVKQAIDEIRYNTFIDFKQVDISEVKTYDEYTKLMKHNKLTKVGYMVNDNSLTMTISKCVIGSFGHSVEMNKMIKERSRMIDKLVKCLEKEKMLYDDEKDNFIIYMNNEIDTLLIKLSEIQSRVPLHVHIVEIVNSYFVAPPNDTNDH